MSLRSSDVDHAFDKLQMTIRNTGDRHAILYYRGQRILKTKRSFGSGKIEDNTQHLIRQQLKLSEQQFRDLLGCPLDYEGYIDILRTKGFIPAEPEGDAGREERNV